jgi:CRISPR system Cascade subunit CasB
MTERELDPKVAAFFERLDRLDAGGRARLKRSAGQSLAESRDALGLFYSVLPRGVSAFQEDMYFLAATLYPMAAGGGRGDLGDSLRQAQQGKNAKGLDRRVQILLDADEAQLPFRLRQAIHFLQSTRTRVNWPRLLDDLLRWTHPDRFVQRQWARSYFAESQVSF